MSCNGCRVLRKGCSENCILRPCLQSIKSPDSQGYATVFVAKFFGRAGLMSFISAVPESQRPALFQSLLFEAAGRTVNPINGAVGLLWTGNWNVCQAAVETILHGGTLHPMKEIPPLVSTSDDSSEGDCAEDDWMLLDAPLAGANDHCRFSNSRSKASPKQKKSAMPTGPCPGELDLRLSPGFIREANFRPGTPSMNSEEESVTTMFNNNNFVTCFERHVSQNPYAIRSNKLLNLFP